MSDATFNQRFNALPDTSQSRFPASEIATLEVNGQTFSDWESIYLQYRLNDAWAHFRFIAAERMPPPANWPLLQFKPGDFCVVTLAGQTALTGIITDRQTSYDANRHQVQLIGKSLTHWGYKSSVDTPTGSFDGQNLTQVFNAVVAPYPGQPYIKGTIDPTPFVKLQNNVGELTWDFLERIARQRGAILGCDQFGHYTLIGQHTSDLVSQLQEGVNIKACECLVSEDDLMSLFEVRAQLAGTDDVNGADANEITCTVEGQATLYSKLITPGEEVASQVEVCTRAANEMKWHAATQIVANIVTYGWTYDGTNLWSADQNVTVDSPMAMLPNLVMKIRTVTFEQSDQTGTQTTLELLPPWTLNDDGNWNPGGVPGIPTPTNIVTQGEVVPPPEPKVTIGPITVNPPSGDE